MRNRAWKRGMGSAAFMLFVLFFVNAGAGGEPQSSGPTYLYKTTFVRAAPGKLLDLIALYKSRMAVADAAGDERPFWWRHTQGDQWDLMLLYPMGSYAEFYAPDRIARRKKAEEAVKKAFEGTAYDHSFG